MFISEKKFVEIEYLCSLCSLQQCRRILSRGVDHAKIQGVQCAYPSILKNIIRGYYFIILLFLLNVHSKLFDQNVT